MKRVFSALVCVCFVLTLISSKAHAIAFVAALPAAAPSVVEGAVVAKALIAAGVTAGGAAVVTKVVDDFKRTHPDFKREIMQGAKVVVDSVTGAYHLVCTITDDTWSSVRSWVADRFDVGNNVISDGTVEVRHYDWQANMYFCSVKDGISNPSVMLYSPEGQLQYRIDISVLDAPVPNKYQVNLYNADGTLLQTKRYVDSCYTGYQYSNACVYVDGYSLVSSTRPFKLLCEVLNSVPLPLWGEEQVCDNLGWDWVNPSTGARTLDVPLYPDERGEIIIAGQPYSAKALDEAYADVAGKTYTDVIAERISGVDVPMVGTTDIPAEGTIDYPGETGAGAESKTSLKALMFSRFPFCLPWDIKNTFALLLTKPKAPAWQIDLVPPAIKSQCKISKDTTWYINMDGLEIVGVVCRWTSTIGFCLALMVLTRRIIRS